MKGLTIKEIAEIIGISETATKQRLFIKGIKPVSYAALYDPDVVDQIKEVPPRGRPKKEAAPEPAKPKAKKPVTTKKPATPDKGESGKRRGTP